MDVIELNTVELFKSLLEVELGEKLLDLHNDFDFKELKFSNNVNELSLIFADVKNSKELIIVFHSIIILELELPLGNDLIIDNFYRGRYEFEEKLFDEYLNKKCYYIEFDTSGKINLLAEKVFFVM